MTKIHPDHLNDLSVQAAAGIVVALTTEEHKYPWRNPEFGTKGEYEEALDAGKLYVAMHGGKWWLARRNGKTQTWKRTPEAFRIPIKAGLRATHGITHLDNVENYRIADSREAAETDGRKRAPLHGSSHTGPLHRY